MQRQADTIVIGAGSAGCVIASRMTESSAHDVALFEAGPDYPGARPADLLDGTRNAYATHDWRYAHRTSSAATFRVPLPRGRVVGGSSAINTCVALRGVAADYDEWASHSLPSWSWRECLPAFLRLERDLDAVDGLLDREAHGLSGPLSIRRAKEHELTPWSRAFRDACVELGFPAVADHNDPRTLGVGPHPRNVVDGVRQDAASCWLDARVRARKNLRIVDHALVHRILFRRGRVTGVEIERHGAMQTWSTNRVVLSAGSIATPGVLLRSGIGAQRELAQLGVERVAEVPSGFERLLDHPGSATFVWPREDGMSQLDAPLLQMALRLRSKHGTIDGDLQIQAGSYWFFPIGTGVSVPGVGMMLQVGKPRGSGRLRYVSRDPHVHPVIDSQLFSHPADRAVAIEGLEIARELYASQALRGRTRAIWPRPFHLADPARLDALLPSLCDSGYHPCGTVPMGRATDAYGRIDGIEGLHIADASLFPTIPTANIHLAVLMLAERFGEALRDDRPI